MEALLGKAKWETSKYKHRNKTKVHMFHTVDPLGVEIDPLDCESQERDLLMVLCDDPEDLCVRCLDLWDFWVSSEAAKSAQAQAQLKSLLGPKKKR